MTTNETLDLSLFGHNIIVEATITEEEKTVIAFKGRPSEFTYTEGVYSCSFEHKGKTYQRSSNESKEDAIQECCYFFQLSKFNEKW